MKRYLRSRQNQMIWGLLFRWTSFHNLDLYIIYQSNIYMILASSLIEILQRISLIHLNLPENVNISTFHKWLLMVIIPRLWINDSLISSNYSAIVGLAGYMVIKNLIFFRSFRICNLDQIQIERYRPTMQIIAFLNSLDLHAILLPILRLCIIEILKGCIAEVLISIFVLFLLIIELLIDTNLASDLRFIKVGALSTWNIHWRYLRVFGLLLLTIFDTALTSPIESVKIFLNMLNGVFAIVMIIDQYYYLHFQQIEIIYYCGIMFNCIHLIESLMGSAFLSFKGINTLLNLDYLLAVLILLLLNLLYKGISRRTEGLLQQYVYEIDDENIATNYFERLVLMSHLPIQENDRLPLISTFKLHFNRCKNIECLCFLLKFSYTKLSHRRFEDAMTEYAQTKKNLSTVVYSDPSIIEEIKKDHLSANLGYAEFDEVDSLAFLINIRSIDVSFAISSFMRIVLQNIRSKQRILCMYLAYLTFNVNSFVSALLTAYNYTYSRSYRESRVSIAFIIKLQNYIKIAAEKLELESERNALYELSSLSFVKIKLYSDRVDQIEEEQQLLIRDITKFYAEAQDQDYKFKYMCEIAERIQMRRKELESSYNKIIAEKRGNSRLLILHYNYKRIVERCTRNELISEKKSIRIGIDREHDVMGHFKASRFSQTNFYSKDIITVFVTIPEERFLITKASSNIGKFLGYNTSELEGEELKNLIMNGMAHKHDTYISNFLNQKNAPINMMKAFEGFMKTKDSSLKRAIVITKFQTLLTDDAYICGMIIPFHDQSHLKLGVIFDNAGEVIGKNEIGTALFQGIPNGNLTESLLLALPSVVKILEKPKDLGESKNMYIKSLNKKELPENICGDTSELILSQAESFFFISLVISHHRYTWTKKPLNRALEEFSKLSRKEWNILVREKQFEVLTAIAKSNGKTISDLIVDLEKVEIDISRLRYPEGSVFFNVVITKCPEIPFQLKSLFGFVSKYYPRYFAELLLTPPTTVVALCNSGANLS